MSERKIIERSEAGRYVRYPDGMKEFAEKTAGDLLAQFPDVDYFDLKNIFEMQFNFAFSVCMRHEIREWKTNI